MRGGDFIICEDGVRAGRRRSESDTPVLVALMTHMSSHKQGIQLP